MTYQKLSDIDRIERVWEQGRIEVWRRSDGIWGVSLLPDEGKRGYPGVTYAPGPDAPPGFPQEYNPDVLLTWARENWQATDTSPVDVLPTETLFSGGRCRAWWR